MKPARRVGLTGVCAQAVCAGTIASSSGSATAAPAPRRNVRRRRCFLVRYKADLLLLSVTHGGLGPSQLPVALPPALSPSSGTAELLRCRAPAPRNGNLFFWPRARPC